MLKIRRLLEESFIEIKELIQNKDNFTLGNVLDGLYNISEDNVKHLDIVSNKLLINKFSNCSCIRNIGSEENEKLLETKFKDAPYLICFDPLDGSSNIDVNITIGTIFVVYQYDSNNKIKNGRNIVMAGYCLYGGATQLIIAQNDVYMYQLFNNKFVEIKKNYKMNNKGNIYSINESKQNIWLNKNINNYIQTLKNNNYNMRWVGSLVADGHRTLLKGGFFCYPANNKDKNGKIRLLYEAYPFAYIFEKAGGKASDGIKDLLDVDFPENIHQKTPIILSSLEEFINFK